jgi:deazaflavin-dependent oxidoreductase (nitroreductase family)
VPVPKWIAQVNKRFFNKMELRRGKRPVIVHVGRKSGKTFYTPLDAHEVDGGYVFFCMYGADSDWVKNVMAAGRATLQIEEDRFELEKPRLISREEAQAQVAAGTNIQPGRIKGIEYLRMDIAA